MSTKSPAKKVVAGMSRQKLTEIATQKALETNQSPRTVQSWQLFFDTQPCDLLRDKGGEACKGCKDSDKCEGLNA